MTQDQLRVGALQNSLTTTLAMTTALLCCLSEGTQMDDTIFKTWQQESLKSGYGDADSVDFLQLLQDGCVLATSGTQDKDLARSFNKRMMRRQMLKMAEHLSEDDDQESPGATGLGRWTYVLQGQQELAIATVLAALSGDAEGSCSCGSCE